MRPLKGRRTIWLTLPALMSICGCSGPINVALIPPPADKLTCSAEPLAPADASPAEQVAYMIALRAAWWDCWSTVRWHKDWWEAQR